MAKRQAASSAKERPVVLGIRISDGLRKSVKIEAARRGITVAVLFEEMWRGYSERQHVGSR
ncbi:hypothetical protein [Rhizobium laguerreae]|uniref:hypothetical protein n=1 Tax=Rhizobium laguerreae TaxID=1076926 RepID=UPI001C9109FE|nr:hypothetical protein [Rhizobium laguerreae]MBY3115639.1 hypothetical protein [Rhizobium laguerreae]